MIVSAMQSMAVPKSSYQDADMAPSYEPEEAVTSSQPKEEPAFGASQPEMVSRDAETGRKCFNLPASDSSIEVTTMHKLGEMTTMSAQGKLIGEEKLLRSEGGVFSPVSERRRLMPPSQSTVEGPCPGVNDVQDNVMQTTPQSTMEGPCPGDSSGSHDEAFSYSQQPAGEPGCQLSSQPASNQNRVFVCKMCLQMWQTAAALRLHQQDAHGNELPYQCHVCSKRFFWSGSLSRHLRIHSGSKPYGCSTCGKRFTQSGTLQRHTRTHTGEKPYECQLCWRKFSTNSNLSQHMKTHRKNGDFIQRPQPSDHYGDYHFEPTHPIVAAVRTVSFRNVFNKESNGFGVGCLTNTIGRGGSFIAQRNSRHAEGRERLSEQTSSVSSVSVVYPDNRRVPGGGFRRSTAEGSAFRSPDDDDEREDDSENTEDDMPVDDRGQFSSQGPVTDAPQPGPGNESQSLEEQENMVVYQLEHLDQHPVSPHCGPNVAFPQRVDVCRFSTFQTQIPAQVTPTRGPGAFDVAPFQECPSEQDYVQACESEMFRRRREAAELALKGSMTHSAFVTMATTSD